MNEAVSSAKAVSSEESVPKNHFEPETSGNVNEKYLREVLNAPIETLDIETLRKLIPLFLPVALSDFVTFLNIFQKDKPLAISLVNGYREAGMDGFDACLQVGFSVHLRERALEPSEPKPSKKLQRFVSFLLRRLPIE